MIALEPSARPTFDALLHNSRGTVFPECFYSFLHNYVASVNELQSPSPFASPPSIQPSVPPPTVNKPNQRVPVVSPEGPSDILPSDSDHRMERIWADYESVEPYLEPENETDPIMDVKIDYLSSTSVSKPFQVGDTSQISVSKLMIGFQDVYPVELNIPNHDSKLPAGRRAASEGMKPMGTQLPLLSFY